VVAVTIMVLELRVPAGHDFAALRHAAGTSLLSCLLSFIHVGTYCNNHHHMFQLVPRICVGVLWPDLALSFFSSLFSLATAWIDDSRYAHTPLTSASTRLG
jgi:uncharacterized membrane protein